MARWLVAYTLNPAVPVKVRVDEYPDLGVRFGYDGDGKLSGLEHTIDMPDEALPHGVASASTEKLDIVWAALEFEHGIPVRADPRVARVEGGHVVGAFTSTMSVSCSAVVVALVHLPRADSVRTPDPRLRQWLALANGARIAADPGDALASYYVILEDVYGKRPSRAVLEVKYVRDFVSHPEIGNRDAIEYLKREFGAGVTRYEPHNPRHREFVARARDRARALAESEIRKLL